jgi:hypothetical protein
VLPTFRNRNGHEEYAFSDFFDHKKLGEAYKGKINFMDASEYIALHGDKTDVNIFLRYNDANQGLTIGCPNDDESGQEGYYMYQPHSLNQPDGGSTAVTWSYAGARMTSSKHLCWNFCFENSNNFGAGSKGLANLLLDEVGREEPRATSIFMGGFDRVLPDWNDDDAKVYERKFLTYTPVLLAEGKRFMKAQELIPKRYIAVHWRRGDFQHHHSREYSTTEQMGQALYRLCKKRKLFTVFMATDTYASEVDAVRKHAQQLVREDTKLCKGGGSDTCPTLELQLYKYQSDLAATALNPMQRALVEQVVASEAGFFVGTLHSTFSHEIHYQRKALGFDWDSSDGTLIAGAGVVDGVRWSD